MNISISTFKKFLRHNVVEFYFYEDNGTIRKAIGTTNMFYINQMNHDAVSKVTDTCQQPDYLIRYYDINEQCWRSFHQNNLHHFENIVMSLFGLG